MDFQVEKQVVRDYYAEIDRAEGADIARVMQRYCAQDYLWRGF
ncbi:MAG TPA: polyketide cyclase, partial [Planktomarina temperata]|nr:polyketide cyclase [Planktomarina temperata]